jgi:gas vesicle protein
MKKKHPGRNFMLGAMLGSTIGAVSAMLFTTKKGNAIKKNAMNTLHEFENNVKKAFHKKKSGVRRLVHSGKRKVMHTMKHMSKVTAGKRTKRR